MFKRRSNSLWLLSLALATNALVSLVAVAQSDVPAGAGVRIYGRSGNRKAAEDTAPDDTNGRKKDTEPKGPSESAGEVDVALQSYYLGGSSQSTSTSGLDLKFNEFVGGFGLVTGSFQGYGNDGNLRTGEDFIDLQRLSFLGQHWRLTGGDFRLSPNLVTNPFTNIYNPEIGARGFRMEVARDKRTYGFFTGHETLQSGPRVTFRVSVPQSLMGGFVQQQVGDRLQLGIRYTHFAASETDIAKHTMLFPVGRQFVSADSLTAQSSYSFSKHFKFYTEAALSRAQQAGTQGNVAGGPVSMLAGPAWETPRFTLRANYAYQTASYLPVVGFFSGDRRGPFAEARYKVKPWLEFSGSASRYSNNLAHNPDVADFRSSNYTAGASATLPWKLNANGSVSQLNFAAFTPQTGLRQDSNNQQILVSVARALGRHNLRLSYMGLNLASNISPQKQKSIDVEDSFVWKRLVLGGAVRTQHSDSTESRQTLFFRGSAQISLSRFSAYGYIEKGSDLVNKTLFSTSAYSSSVVGLNAPITHGWSVQLEAFRNRLNTNLNPASLFVLENQGFGLGDTLSTFDQWSAYVRLSKRFRWGRGAATGGWDNYAAVHNPLVGAVEGVVMQEMMAGKRAVRGIPVSLDGTRASVSDANGHYRFIDVPEGVHHISLDTSQLPADFDSGGVAETDVKVEPRAVARTDFNVARLTYATGKVAAPAGMALENVLIRLLPGDRYTTPDADGNFGFYNLREGDYELVVDAESLPADSTVVSAARLPISVRLDAAPVNAQFELGVRKSEKPVRLMIQQEIGVDSSSGSNRGTQGGRSGQRSGGSRRRNTGH